MKSAVVFLLLGLGISAVSSEKACKGVIPAAKGEYMAHLNAELAWHLKSYKECGCSGDAVKRQCHVKNILNGVFKILHLTAHYKGCAANDVINDLAAHCSSVGINLPVNDKVKWENAVKNCRGDEVAEIIEEEDAVKICGGTINYGGSVLKDDCGIDLLTFIKEIALDLGAVADGLVEMVGGLLVGILLVIESLLTGLLG